ncbi:WXG100 family type VII secretion target [Nocardioides luteus]|uniref:ESAT-6-like protein n=1 Tax=Nocardioides luteus TaxID=1844 RepID=A0ABQ5SQF5_9ACTN|nr:WXG100 family type VII secretion target [Nocardioides luteus]MDR7313322.1 WXG100 family type VII secretion target [Nocardioides luteus]GGR60214.1 hypothetical protein GCM10010197_28850 [Nocardioides luteus]GLJ66387.1 hypothetical protein GCM10017579_04230 [Nocardioides luteus]
MGEEIVVNHGDMANIIDTLSNGVKKMDGELSNLENRINKLKSEFTGEAANAYAQAQAKWDRAVAEIQQSLAQSAAFVGQSQQDMQNADRRGAAGFGG